MRTPVLLLAFVAIAVVLASCSNLFSDLEGEMIEGGVTTTAAWFLTPFVSFFAFSNLVQLLIFLAARGPVSKLFLWIVLVINGFLLSWLLMLDHTSKLGIADLILCLLSIFALIKIRPVKV